MKTERQLSIFLENKPGVLAEMCRDLAAHRINLRALTVADHVDHAVVRLVVDKPTKAIHVLEERGALVVVSEVMAVSVADKPGALASLARKLARQQVNIDYLYGSSTHGGGRVTLYLRVSKGGGRRGSRVR
jgi:hypothetical protein